MQTSAGNGRAVLALRPPLDADLTLERFRRWGVDPANVVQDGALYRVVRAEGRLWPDRLAVRGSPAAPTVHVAVGGGGSAAVGAAVRREARALLGLDAPLAEFYRHVADDPVLGPFTRPAGGLVGLRPSHAADLFEMLVGAISAQQINLPFAFATRSRLVRRLGSPVAWSGVTVYGFPTPERVAQASMATLRRLQFSTRKAEYIVGLARAIADGRLDLEALREAPDEAVIGRLTAQRGLGRWTAEWFLARGLGRPDICPADDLGVRRAMEALCFGGRPATPADVRRRMAVWRPYRSLAVHYLLAGFRQRATAPAGRLPAATAGGRR